ncbi:Pseudouridine synthase family protein [Abeliophyllum distichum]|uniref:tRNA pseudouridine synthase n=1 Tax=Abeliophyllum distichum TaxID=126358 RepID=A0ABD1PD32_9LAMI
MTDHLLQEDSKHSRYQLPESTQRPSKVAKIKGEDFTDDAAAEQDEGEEERKLVEKNMNPNPRLQRYLVAIEYIGTRFSGAQQQSNCRTVVGVLEEAFQKFIGHPVSIFCSSRTDAGVHALSNVCHVDVERISKRKPGEVLPPHEPSVVKRAVNHFLQLKNARRYRTQTSPVELQLLSEAYIHPCRTCDFLACHYMYFYRLSTGKEPLSTFEKDRAWHVPEELDLLAMQVRLLVGVLKAVGTGDLTVPDVERILKVKTVTAASPMAPACGLYLGHVKYDLPSDA